MVAAVKGYKLVLVMPDSMSIERRRLMLAYGATFVLTPRAEGMKGAIAKAQQLIETTPESWMPQQFDNPANIDVHVRTTAREILDDFPEGLDVLITGVGTGGHITGCARVLKKAWPAFKVYAVEPAASPVISGGAPSPHPIQGIGAGFIPAILDTKLLDGTIQSRPKRRRRWRVAPGARRACWWGYRRARRWRRSRRSFPSYPPDRECSASTTIPASATFPSKDSCPSSERAWKKRALRLPALLLELHRASLHDDLGRTGHRRLVGPLPGELEQVSAPVWSPSPP
jgi:hypothetical protein